MTDTYSTQHPHEPDVPPIYGDDGGCVVCGIEYRVGVMAQHAARLEAENVQLRQLADLFRFNFSPWLIHNAPDLYRSIWGEW